MNQATATPLSIGIDGYNIAMPHGTGVATYGFALAEAIAGLGHRVEGVFGLPTGATPQLSEVLFFDALGRGPEKKRGNKYLRWARETARALRPVRTSEVPLSGLVERKAFANRLPPLDRIVSATDLFAVAEQRFALTGRFLRLRMARPPAIMHWTYPVPVEVVGSRNVYTLHDLVPLRLPYTTLDRKQDYHAIVKRCTERAAHICTVSEASRRDILATFPIDPARVTNSWQVAPLPAGTAERDPAEERGLIEGVFGLRQQGYFLYFGAIEPKKNVGRLAEAYLSLQTQTPLVIVGGRSWQADEEVRLLGSDRIMKLDYLPRATLMTLLRNARALCFPSLYEGFGLPALEAMRLGTPVLTSNTSSLPEVVGEAGLTVDPYDVQAIANAMRALDEDAALRQRLSAAGLVQAGRFSMTDYRARLAAMYAAVLA